MASLKGARLGHPVLREKASDVELADIKAGKFRTLLEDMVETMHAYEGVGLAGPQVHLPLRVFVFEKGGDYYFSSLAFLIKFGVFIGVASLSLMPTLEFLSWRKALRKGEMPVIAERRLRMIQGTIHGELMAIVVILLCSAIMARGGLV